MINLRNLLGFTIILGIFIFLGTSFAFASDVSNVTVGDFHELNEEINQLSSGDVYEVNKDYEYRIHQGSKIRNMGINIAVDNIIINGNGHVIDGKGKSAILKITGNNVKINNLTILNGQGYRYKDRFPIGPILDCSPIQWMGHNGVISDCEFIENSGVKGGAISWIGNNGVINNSYFIRNVANFVGGGLYIKGNNVIVNNTVFLKSESELCGEAVYIDCKSQNTILSNCIYSGRFLINATTTGIDVYNLNRCFSSLVGDKEIDLIPIIFKAIYCGLIKIDDELSGYANYENDKFTLSMIRNFGEYGITYQKDYIFIKTTLNEVFSTVSSDGFYVSLTLTKIIDFNNDIDIHANNKLALYEYACKGTVDSLIKSSPVIKLINADIINILQNNKMGDDIPHKSSVFNSYKVDYTPVISSLPRNRLYGVTYALNVFYSTNDFYKTNVGWNKNNGFDFINIFGNGVTISANAGNRDEYKWIETDYNQVYVINNLTISGFNIAIDNRQGYCVLNNVILENNKMDYISHRDDGAAILNSGVVICNNCTFFNNYAKNGGAIFTQGILSLTNCTFSQNKGYGTGNDVLNVDQGMVFVDGDEVKGSKGVVTYVESISTSESKLYSYLAAGLSFIAGLLAGVVGFVVSGNPVVAVCAGIAVGALIGGFAGGVAAYTITSGQYNLQFDRVKTAVSVIFGAVYFGMMGGVVGATVVGPAMEYDPVHPVNGEINGKISGNLAGSNIKDYDRILSMIEESDIFDAAEILDNFSPDDVDFEFEGYDNFENLGLSLLTDLNAKWPNPTQEQAKILKLIKAYFNL